MTQLMGSQLLTALLPILRLSLWLAILVVIFVPLERLFAAHPQKIWRKGIVTDLGYFFLSSLLPALILSVPVGMLAWAVHRAVPGGLLEATAAMPLWARSLAGLVAGEIGYYWGHRWSHEIPFLWRFHSIHHSAEDLDFLVHTRAHPVDMVFGRFCSLVPIFVLGLGGPVGPSGSVVPVIATLIGTVWGFFVHANLRWRFGPLEWLISTPAFHHWHHTRTGPINRNYASTLPWLDRVFGTHYLPANEWPEAYGIKAKMPDSLIDQLTYPLLPPPPVLDQPEAASPTQEIPPDVSLDEGQAPSAEIETRALLDGVEGYDRDASVYQPAGELSVATETQFALDEPRG
jgi:sterol desaturase/sphingolipid hydroxylase (fatty acid hydroxylase superfamily)